jgi:hypothetical protein
VSQGSRIEHEIVSQSSHHLTIKRSLADYQIGDTFRGCIEFSDDASMGGLPRVPATFHLLQICVRRTPPCQGAAVFVGLDDGALCAIGGWPTKILCLTFVAVSLGLRGVAQCQHGGGRD